MYNYFKAELKRAIFSKYFFIAFSITLMLLVYSFFEFISLGWNSNPFNFHSLENYYDSFDIFIISRTENRASYLGLLAPLLASLVYSDSYLSDKSSGYLNFIYIRTNKKNYIITKLLVNILSSGLSIVLASLLMLIFLISIFGITINSENVLNLSGPFSNIYYSGNKSLYFFIILSISFIFNCIFSTLSLAISTFVNNKYISFLAPFFYYIISGSLFIIIGVSKLNATRLFMPKNDISISETIIYQSFLLILGTITFIYGVLFADEKIN